MVGLSKRLFYFATISIEHSPCDIEIPFVLVILQISPCVVHCAVICSWVISVALSSSKVGHARGCSLNGHRLEFVPNTSTYNRRCLDLEWERISELTCSYANATYGECLLLKSGELFTPTPWVKNALLTLARVVACQTRHTKVAKS